jgi:hypothetical protein
MFSYARHWWTRKHYALVFLRQALTFGDSGYSLADFAFPPLKTKSKCYKFEMTRAFLIKRNRYQIRGEFLLCHGIRSPYQSQT